MGPANARSKLRHPLVTGVVTDGSSADAAEAVAPARDFFEARAECLLSPRVLPLWHLQANRIEQSGGTQIRYGVSP
jgi:hypothetical protein